MKSGARKIIRVILIFNLAALAAVGVFVMREGSFSLTAFPKKPTLPYLGVVNDFELTAKDGRPFRQENLMKQPWIASFMFTSCAGQCPVMNARLERLQKELPEGIFLVSFSVDPLTDTPEVLRSYAKKYHADENRWFFLTGQKSEIDQVLSNFYMNGSDNPSLHSFRLVLVDSQSNLRGFYDSLDENSIRQLLKDVKKLVKENPNGR